MKVARHGFREALHRLLYPHRKYDILIWDNKMSNMTCRVEIMQGTLALMVLRTLQTMGLLHGYGIARRIEQISG